MRLRVLKLLVRLLRIIVLATTMVLVGLASTTIRGFNNILDYLSFTLLLTLLLYIIVEAMYRVIRVD